MPVVNITSPSGQRNWICDPKAAPQVEEAYRRVRGITGLKKAEQEAMVIDFGGAVLAGEEDITVEAGGIKIVMPVSQFEDVLDILKTRKESTAMPGAIRSFGGWMGYHYVIAVETRQALVAEMERIWPEVKPKAEAEVERWKTLRK